MGENEARIFVIGSPDIDLMVSKDLPSLFSVRKHYEIPFDEYAIFICHPVTTNLHATMKNIREVLGAARKSGENYVVIYPNNDTGSDIIIEEYEQIKDHPNFRVYPTLRFEAFLVLLKNCKFIIGNSSAGIREAPFYGIATINIGSRQNGRFYYDSIVNVNDEEDEIVSAIENIQNIQCKRSVYFGDGRSTDRFLNILKEPATWETIVQKYFIDQRSAVVEGPLSVLTAVKE